MTNATTKVHKYRELEKSIASLWLAFQDLHEIDPASLSNADARLWFEVTKHSSVKQRLTHALEKYDHE